MMPEQRLWQSVVLQAVRDATANDSKVVTSQRAKRSADAWLRYGGRDFRTVCALAGFDPDFIREKYVSGKLDGERYCCPPHADNSRRPGPQKICCAKTFP